jgi:BirA family biotin operon repressor/biotin-[acetyl-CoA-carboxylase] ligase
MTGPNTPAGPGEFPPSLLTARRIGARIDRHPIVDSTNQSAFDAAAAGAPDGAVIVADAQRAGRGRLGRRWDSPTGRNLYLSILLRGPFLPPVVTGLPFLGAIAARDAIRELTGLTTQLKWPNDLMINGRKVGGILVEARSAGGETTLAVVGIGVNVNWPTRAMPDELRATATSLEQELGRPLDRPGLLAALLNRFDSGYDRLRDEGGNWVMEDWSRSCLTLGRMVSVETSTGTLAGLAEAVEPSGHLRLRHTDGSISRLSVEATVRLRPADDNTPISGGIHHAVRD